MQKDKSRENAALDKLNKEFLRLNNEGFCSDTICLSPGVFKNYIFIN